MTSMLEPISGIQLLTASTGRQAAACRTGSTSRSAISMRPVISSARVYGPARISTPDKITRVRLSGLAAGPLRLSQTDLRMTVDYQAAPAAGC